MAQQDKTDFYWNGALAGTINNLYYDLINVDVCHVPYATSHRNSSFFLKTRLAYSIAKVWSNSNDTANFEVTDLKILWNESCDNTSGNVYAMWRNWNIKAIFAAPIRATSWTVAWCVWPFTRCTQEDIVEDSDCADWKLFVTDFVLGNKYEKDETIWSDDQVLELIPWSPATEATWLNTGIQINQFTGWTTTGLFSDENVLNGYAKFKDGAATAVWNYLLVYQSRNLDWDGFAWQVRMITWIDNEGRLVLDSPWLWFRVPTSAELSELKAWEKKEVSWGGVAYAIFTERWEVIGFSHNKNVEIMYWPWDCRHMTVYDQTNGHWSAKWQILSTVAANNKIFVLTKNGYIHYNKDTWGYNKFFINDDMFAGEDKTSLVAYRDMILAFWRNHIALWVPDEQNNYWTMYNQSATIWTRSRYSYWEYNWDIIFVSNDKRLLALWVASTWRYGLTFKEGEWFERLNWKLSMLRPWDEVFVWDDNNNLRILCNVSSDPFEASGRHADMSTSSAPSSTHIYKFDTLFQVWTEDHISWHLIKWAAEGVYYWEEWIYVRDDKDVDCWDTAFTTKISAFMVENENNGLDNHPLLFQLIKLNRLITTLGPGVYTNTSKIKITNYSKWIGYTYEFPVDGDWNLWLWLMTNYYLEEALDDEQKEKLDCAISSIQDSLRKYQPNCSEWEVMRQYVVQNAPRCEDYDELLTESHWVCINDKIYELAPTMPLTTSLGGNQDYSTQIKIELIGGQWDIITFWWWLAELYLAPLFQKWPDWEYQLQPNTDCD